MESLANDVFAGTPDFSAAVLAVQNLAQSKINNSAISCGDKKLIVAFYSIAEHLFLYFDEQYGDNFQGPNAVQFRDCGFFDRIGCFFETVFTSMLNGFAAGVNIFENAILDLSAGIAGAAIGAAIGVVQGLIVAFDSDQCCPDELSCHRVLGVSLKFTDCNHIAEYTAFGFGADDVTLGWANSGGTPTTATTPTSAPRLTITQTSPSIPVSTGISSVCSNGTINVPPAPFIRNLADLVKDVYGVGILGPTITSGEEETPRTYFASGIVPARYEVLTWFATNGEVVQSNAANAKILWDNSKRKARFLCGFGTFAPKDGLKPFN